MLCAGLALAGIEYTFVVREEAAVAVTPRSSAKVAGLMSMPILAKAQEMSLETCEFELIAMDLLAMLKPLLRMDSAKRWPACNAET